MLNRLTNESVQLLDVLGSSLAHLSSVTAPIHSRATALTAAQRNVGAAKEAVDKLLEHLDTSRRVSGGCVCVGGGLGYVKPGCSVGFWF